MQNRVQTTPVSYPRTMRPDSTTLLTSAKAGKVYPAGFIPMLPEDSLNTTRVAFNITMEETARVLANAVNVRAYAHFVSFAALDRFDGSMDNVANAWAGKAGAPDLATFEAFDKNTMAEFYGAMGIHIPDLEMTNSFYVEAYNRVVNWRREQVSISLPTRTNTDHTLARALWGNTAIARIVPTFDAALEQGAVELVGASAPIYADAPMDGSAGDDNLVGVYQKSTGDMHKLSTDSAGIKFVSNTGTFAELYADMGNVTMTLSSLETAKKTQAFARMREKFAGNDDDLIDLLMRGFRIPSSAFKDPILLGTATGTFGIEQRYATDAANLDQYVTNGMANIAMTIRMPQQPTGGVVMITYEIVPDPVFDRMADMFLTDTPDQYPNALRDTLDPQKVDIVPNSYIDALHGTPHGTFGYQPMNARWARNHTRIGGRYQRTATAQPTDEDQQNIWGVITTNPSLDEDAFLMPADFSHHVFKDTTSDPFRVVANWNASINGITQFGPALYEAQGDYDAVASEVDTTFIDPSANP